MQYFGATMFAGLGYAFIILALLAVFDVGIVWPYYMGVILAYTTGLFTAHKFVRTIKRRLPWPTQTIKGVNHAISGRDS